MSPKSWIGLAEEELLHELEKAVDIFESANYCCGGSIPITTPDDSSSNQKESAEGKFRPIVSTTSTPDRVSLGPQARKCMRKDSVPCFHDFQVNGSASSDLCPSVDVFRKDFLRDRRDHRGVLAEPYKLNIYSGPSGKFKAHVDTPRSMRQFVSPVVCLPCSHQGGVIGFYCDHLYAHTQEDTDDIISYALKGIDMTIFNTFQSLGLVVKACPVLYMDDYRDIVDESESEDESEGKDKVHITRAGTQFHKVVESNFDKQHTNDLGRYLKRKWPYKEYENAAWLKGSGNTSIPAFYAIAYGNESRIMCFYSDAAILIEVPAYDERMAKGLA
ncbi:hypothetical protein BCON_0002g00210 [Botryotinia convoluta]|uniref:Prolyl 4-hydroxylase alpha subunit Fe(2+) 2OG dioxygenase domain-containing protein n=1 Tax=Botryotinia convoluta TaxID=54673 RepID=A0A4Z1IVD4_9HELO|nr:hypothetical protein BCON_0002g00210 [Botryotinia convoluta]